jgi:hypothetical protein
MSQRCAAALGQFEGSEGAAHGQPCAFACVVGAGWVALWIWMAGHACAASSRRLVRNSCACGVCPAGGEQVVLALLVCGVVVVTGWLWLCGVGCGDVGLGVWTDACGPSKAKFLCPQHVA